MGVSSSPRTLHGSSAQLRLQSMQHHYVAAERPLHHEAERSEQATAAAAVAGCLGTACTFDAHKPTTTCLHSPTPMIGAQPLAPM
jgi:hypothetical protein